MNLDTLTFRCIWFLYCLSWTRAFVIMNEDNKIPSRQESIFPETSSNRRLYFDVILPLRKQKSADKPAALMKSPPYKEDLSAPISSPRAAKSSSRSKVDQDSLDVATTRESGNTTKKSRTRPPNSPKKTKILSPRSRETTRRYPAGLVQRRGLADPGTDFREGRSDVVRQKNPSAEYYTYIFVGESFQLNGSASIELDKRSGFKIIFEYSVTGNGNATAHLVTPQQEANFPSYGSSVSSGIISSPDSCHLLDSRNSTRQSSPCKRSKTQQKNDPRQRGNVGISRLSARDRTMNQRQLPFGRDSFAYLMSSLTSPNGPSLSEQYILPQDLNQPPMFGDFTNTARSDATEKCNVTTVTYRKEFLCVGRTAPPCFMMIMQGTKYKVAKKICSNNLP